MARTIHLRLAEPDDLRPILEISNWAAMHTPANFAVDPEPLADWQVAYERTHESHPWVVATDDAGEILGFAKASPHRGRCAYHWSVEVTVYVHPEHHGHGIGSRLYERMIPVLRQQGYHTATAGITRPNEASERLHRRMGFKSVGVFEQIGWKFDRWHDVGYWQLRLADPSSTDASPPALRSVQVAWDETANPPTG